MGAGSLPAFRRNQIRQQTFHARLGCAGKCWGVWFFRIKWVKITELNCSRNMGSETVKSRYTLGIGFEWEPPLHTLLIELARP